MNDWKVWFHLAGLWTFSGFIHKNIKMWKLLQRLRLLCAYLSFYQPLHYMQLLFCNFSVCMCFRNELYVEYWVLMVLIGLWCCYVSEYKSVPLTVSKMEFSLSINISSFVRWFTFCFVSFYSQITKYSTKIHFKDYRGFPFQCIGVFEQLNTQIGLNI